ncbi:MAG: NUDIX domain-containing protein [Croceitalea sp.]|nr:NUDIX domain-containing protein [Croceitalea sp.]
MDFEKFMNDSAGQYLPNLSIDMVIIGYENKQLKCLLLQINNKWVLPGGYVSKTESVDDAAKRIMLERTGLNDAHLSFLTVMGGANRSFKAELKSFFKTKNIPWKENLWIANRFVSLTYYSLVHINNTKLKTGIMFEDLEWFDMNELPPMWLDHKEIVLKAKERLKKDVKQEQFSYKLLPNKFTMPQLHGLHETIMQRSVDRSRFQKQMLASGRFERLPQKPIKNTPGRNPYQYRAKTT